MNKTYVFAIVAVIVLSGVLIFTNHEQNKDAIPLSKIFPSEPVVPGDIEYEYVDTKQPKTKESLEKKASAQKTPIGRNVLITASKDITETSKAKDSNSAGIPLEVKSGKVPIQQNIPTQLSSSDMKAIKFTIQIASFKEKSKADKIFADLRSKKYDAFVINSSMKDSGMRYRVYVGKFVQKSQAEELLAQIKPQFKDSFVIALKTMP